MNNIYYIHPKIVLDSYAFPVTSTNHIKNENFSNETKIQQIKHTQEVLPIEYEQTFINSDKDNPWSFDLHYAFFPYDHVKTTHTRLPDKAIIYFLGNQESAHYKEKKPLSSLIK